jgi:RimJ/RimL family protein N-acetyltransferase
MFDYWVGRMDGVSYAIIMTHPENETISPDYFKPYLARGGKTFSMDFGIGNKDFIGKGLAALTLEEFIKYFAKHIEPEAKMFLIDPDMENPRAIHVYQKAGFKVVSEFVMSKGYFEGEKRLLMVKAVSVLRGK